MLVTQAKAEAARHEQKRATASEKLTGLQQSGAPDAKELADVAGQLVALTKRAILMESQVDVLEGKRKALLRMREAIAGYAADLRGGSEAGGDDAVGADARSGGGAATVAGIAEPPALSRIVLAAQEDLRREIARAMHDGPAQSLTNIVLQAQIVERLLDRDPARARSEVQQLIGMVQQTLDATKSFIFDVRPMVLDDLGLVPTLRRAARDRGRRAGVAVDFESMGVDLRLPMDLESGLFRILDEALAAYLSVGPERVSMRLDWSDTIEARVSAHRSGGPPVAVEPATPEPTVGRDMPPALAAMMTERREAEKVAAEAVRLAQVAALPAGAWREIQARAGVLGITTELLEEGGELRLVAELPEGARPAADPA